MMPYDLKEKRVLVTGGTRGIGREITRAFADAGARLVVCYREDRAAADTLAEQYGDVRVVRADISSAADVAFTNLGYDSLAVLELSSRVEREYAVSIPDGAALAMRTPGGAVAYVNERLTASA